MVHGELELGRRSGGQERRDRKLPAASPQARTDGCHSRHRARGGRNNPDKVEWPKGGRVEGAHRVTPNEIAATLLACLAVL